MDNWTLTNLQFDSKRDSWTLTYLIQSDSKRDSWTLTYLIQFYSKRDNWTLTYLPFDSTRDNWTLTYLQADSKRNNWTLTYLQFDSKRDIWTLTSPRMVSFWKFSRLRVTSSLSTRLCCPVIWVINQSINQSIFMLETRTKYYSVVRNQQILHKLHIYLILIHISILYCLIGIFLHYNLCFPSRCSLSRSISILALFPFDLPLPRPLFHYTPLPSSLPSYFHIST